MVGLDNSEYRTVILAAFLHDIGKLLGRGKFQMLDKGQHPKFSADFVSAYSDLFKPYCDVALLKELVQKHHENQKAFPPEFLVQSIKDPHIRCLATLISTADNLSSSERGAPADQYQDYKKIALRSVLAILNNTGELPTYSFHPHPLAEPGTHAFKEAIFPGSFKEYNDGELNKLIESFGITFKTIFNAVKINDFEIFYRMLSAIIYQHTWCIPSNTQEIYPDVSLYDHSRTAAAIAACLYQVQTENDTLSENQIRNSQQPRFLLVSGDISGIQRYIFDVSTSTAGGVARRLRARSLFIQLCSEIACHKILHRLNLPDWNILMNSGGNFLLLVPNIANSESILNTVQSEIDDWFIHRMNAELAINFCHISFDDNGFRAGTVQHAGFGNTLYKVKNLLNKRKTRRFMDALQRNNRWESDAFKMDISFEGEAVCECCGKFPAIGSGDDARVCDQCAKQGKVGSKLPSARYLYFYDKPDLGDIEILNYSVTVLDKLSVGQAKPYLICQVNDPTVAKGTAYPVITRYIANYVPRNSNELMTFQDIAEKAAGQRLLGFLKADVDNLGELFIFGLKQDNASSDTMSRLATLSRLVDFYFTGWTEHLVRTEFKHCYTVFSGGDDLFYVGPWDEVLDLAERINQDFQKFTGNEKITLSAGIFIAKPSYPIARAADEAADALNEAKKSSYKNSICILGHVLPWTELGAVKSMWHQLLKIDQAEGGLSSALLYKLLDFAAMWQEYRKGDISGLRFHPLLTYQIKRNLNPSTDAKLIEWLQPLLKWPPDDNSMKRLNNLGLIAQLCLFSKRGGKE